MFLLRAVKQGFRGIRYRVGWLFSFIFNSTYNDPEPKSNLEIMVETLLSMSIVIVFQLAVIIYILIAG